MPVRADMDGDVKANAAKESSSLLRFLENIAADFRSVAYAESGEVSKERI